MQTILKGKGLTIFRVIIAVWVIGTIVYAGVVVLDIHSEPANMIPIRLEAWLGNPTETADITMALFVRFNGTLVAGNSVEQSGFAYLNTSEALNFNITRIALGIKLCQTWPSKNDSGGMPEYTNLELTLINGTNRLEGESVVGYWPNPGDYAPTFTIYANGMKYPNDFPLSNVHVEPASELQAEKFNRLSVGLTYVITSLALIEAVLLIRRILIKRPRKQAETSLPMIIR